MEVASLQGPREIEPGHRLDRYELLCPIAEGGMASVWLARIEGKHGFEKLVAVKTILPKFATDVQFERMLLDESRIASRIEHANVAQILDLGEHHEVLYLVLEWIEGESLSRLARSVKKKGLSIPHGVLMRILADTCGGLHAAHELRGNDGRLLGVIHRDVSPQNILVSNTGVAKLIDFGIAKARDRLVGETSAGVLKGKVRYMAPEQALGRPTDRRADLWAVGSILYRLLSGKAPYEGENDLASLNLLTAGKPPAPLPSTVHPAVVAIVTRALSHPPEGRFATAADMQAAMESAMIAAGIPTTTSQVAKYAAEHLAPYTAKRQSAVQLALGAAAERQRMKQLLQPMVHTEVSTDVSRVGGPWHEPATLVDVDYEPTKHMDRPPPASLPPPLNGGANGVSPPSSGPPRSVPAPFPLPPRLPPLTEPPRRVTSDRSPRVPSPSDPPLEPSIEIPQFRQPMKASVLAAAGVVTFLAVLVVLGLASRPTKTHAKIGRSDTVVTATATATVAVAPTSIASATSVESLPVAAAEPVPTIAATDLPRAQEEPPPPPPPVQPVARPRPSPPPVTHAFAPSPPPVASPTPEPRPRSGVRARVDDGF